MKQDISENDLILEKTMRILKMHDAKMILKDETS